MTNYKELTAELDALLLTDGPLTTTELAQRFPSHERWEISNALTYMSAIRVTGPNRFSASTVYHPTDANAPRPAVDEAVLTVLADGPVASSMFKDAMAAHAKTQVAQACKRLEVRALKSRSGSWYRGLPGQTLDDIDTGVTATPTQTRDVLAVVGSYEGSPQTFSTLVRSYASTTGAEVESTTVSVVRSALSASRDHLVFDAAERTYRLTDEAQAAYTAAVSAGTL